MGKKSTYKKLRKIANGLPVIMQHTHEKHLVSGAELIEQEIMEVKGKPVNPIGRYVQNMPVRIAVNHNRRLKKMYNKHGQAGVKAYVRAVELFQTVKDIKSDHANKPG